jgi:hypothetical protein
MRSLKYKNKFIYIEREREMLDHTIKYQSFSKLNYNTLISKFLITIKK